MHGTHENILIDGNIIEFSSSKLPCMYFRSVCNIDLCNNKVSNKIIEKKCDI